ncbi:hypothetical protein QCA50_013630 [Cerrena zonata]|uniref:Peptidase metallopeptidase domain-containing protein n=1 Tax=Cerrena zonata TaxID=2478898 RepID=A0AAW0FQM7_9APHY
MTSECHLWDNNSIVNIYFFNGTRHQQDKVWWGLEEYSKFVNLEFRECTFASEGDIRIRFNVKVSKSCVGTRHKHDDDHRRPTMQLGKISDSKDCPIQQSNTILHELGHALGLLHEHQSPATFGQLTLKKEETLRYFKKPDFGVKKILENILERYTRKDVSCYSRRCDFQSVMIYHLPKRLNEEGIAIYTQDSLSNMDKAYLTLCYPRLGEDSAEWSITKALDIAGVLGEPRRRILAADDADSIRQIFMEWNENEGEG